MAASKMKVVSKKPSTPSRILKPTLPLSVNTVRGRLGLSRNRWLEAFGSHRLEETLG